MLVKIYKYFNILSLDVVAGACISSLFIARLLHVHLTMPVTALLGLTVWLIYTFDHLQDARSIPRRASTERHRFHQDNFRILTWACILVLLVISLLLFKIPPKTLVWGVSLGSLVGAYFLLLHFLKLKIVYHKEVMIAVIYAAGVLLGPLSVYEGTFSFIIPLIFLQFFALALTNLLSFALFEVKADEQDSSPSLVIVLGENVVFSFLKILVAVQVIVAATLSFQPQLTILEITMLAMILVLGVILFLRHYLMRYEIYRFVGDAAFMLPLIGIFFL